MALVLKKIKDELIEFNFRAIKTVVDILSAGWFSNTKEFADIDLAVGDNTIRTNLGRKYKGILITKRSSAVSIYDKASSTDPDNLLVLNASATATVTIKVF